MASVTLITVVVTLIVVVVTLITVLVTLIPLLQLLPGTVIMAVLVVMTVLCGSLSDSF